MTRTIASVALVVADYDEAIAFYVDLLGFSLVDDTPLGDGRRWVRVAPTGTGAALLKQFLLNKGIDQEITRRVGIVTYEAETNVVIHSKGSGDVYCFIHEDRIIVQVVDNGVGIEDLEKAMKEGYSTAPDYVRELGFGAGMGIPNMKRFSDKLVILSEKNVGTQVEMKVFI